MSDIELDLASDAAVAARADRASKKAAALRVLPFVLYVFYCVARSDLRVEHLLLLGIVTALAMIGPRTRELQSGLIPFGLVALLFDGMRPFQKLGLSPERVTVCGLRGVESRLFGWESNGERFTLHDYFQSHHAPFLDAFCAIPYATFILWCVAGAIFLYGVKDRPAMKRFAWGFFLLNATAFVTYHLIPAAPPWYFHAHGCVVDMATRASEGPVLARVDAMIGIHYFHGMYSKAASVFGALPSLHCAYPLLLVIETWRAFKRPMRAVAIAYYIAMVFSAVYLDHHWVIDALLGSAFAVAISLTIRAFERWRARTERRASAPSARGSRASLAGQVVS